MNKENDIHKWEYEEGKLKSFPDTINMDPLLTKEEMEQIFDREYDKKLNIEGYKEPVRKLKRNKSLNDVVREAKDRISKQQPSPGGQRKEKDNK